MDKKSIKELLMDFHGDCERVVKEELVNLVSECIRSKNEAEVFEFGCYSCKWIDEGFEEYALLSSKKHAEETEIYVDDDIEDRVEFFLFDLKDMVTDKIKKAYEELYGE